MGIIKNQDELISVIVPCYNVEKYLNKCLDSIVNQTYRNLDIVLVDDGATDNTGNICDSYAEKDERIRVIHQENKGISAARNIGLDNAKGKFVVFIDSDDFMARHAVEYFVYLQKKYNADVVNGRTCDLIDTEDGLKYKLEKIIVPDRTATSEEALKSIVQNGCFVNCKLYKKEIFDDIRFPVGVINEDEEVMLKIYDRYSNIVLGGRTAYYYRVRPGSLTTSKFSFKKLDLYYNSIKNLEFIKERHPNLYEYAYARHMKAAIFCSANLHIHRFGAEGKMHRKIIRDELRKDIFKILKSPYLPIKFKLIGLVCAII
ncbi:MAG: glycosyltransferase family 2 protein [Lachnospiraceae bacterium]|nr:glycosyltransferase family 2 protein [Lachnospiraceae bacterium]